MSDLDEKQRNRKEDKHPRYSRGFGLVFWIFLLVVPHTSCPLAGQPREDEPAGEPRVETLIARLKGSRGSNQVNPIRALAKLGPKAKEAVPVLIDVLKGKGSWPCVEALKCLARIGPNAKDAVPVLQTLLRHKNWQVRHGAVAALGAIGKDAREVLLAGLQDKSSSTRFFVAMALARRGSEDKASVPVLVQIIERRKHPYCVIDALEALQDLGPIAKEAVPALIDILRLDDKQALFDDDDLGVTDYRVLAARALARMGGKARAAVPALTERAKKKATAYSYAWKLARAAKKTLEMIVKDKDPGKHGP